VDRIDAILKRHSFRGIEGYREMISTDDRTTSGLRESFKSRCFIRLVELFTIE